MFNAWVLDEQIKIGLEGNADHKNFINVNGQWVRYDVSNQQHLDLFNSHGSSILHAPPIYTDDGKFDGFRWTHTVGTPPPAEWPPCPDSNLDSFLEF